MDKEDICQTYGHTSLRPALEYTYTHVAGILIRSKRRRKVLICTSCGGRED